MIASIFANIKKDVRAHYRGYHSRPIMLTAFSLVIAIMLTLCYYLTVTSRLSILNPIFENIDAVGLMEIYVIVAVVAYAFLMPFCLNKNLNSELGRGAERSGIAYHRHGVIILARYAANALIPLKSLFAGVMLLIILEDKAINLGYMPFEVFNTAVYGGVFVIMYSSIITTVSALDAGKVFKSIAPLIFVLSICIPIALLNLLPHIFSSYIPIICMLSISFGLSILCRIFDRMYTKVGY